MPPKRRRRFQGLYYHSSPPKVLPMNGHIVNNDGRQGRGSNDFSVKLSTIRIWMHEKDIGKLTRVLWAGQGNRLRQQASTNPKVKRFLAAVPYVMNSIKDVHQAVIDNSLETLQSNLEPPAPQSLVTCRDANGLNLIHKAAGLGHATILEYLITTWPDGVHELDITGKTPLHWAASAKNNMRCYTLLTQAGCDEETVDYKMKTPSFYRHKPHEIERAFLTYVPQAPRVSPDIAIDWEALGEDSRDGKKMDIKIPKMNGFGRHSNVESNENTSEAEMIEIASGHEFEELPKDGDIAVKGNTQEEQTEDVQELENESEKEDEKDKEETNIEKLPEQEEENLEEIKEDNEEPQTTSNEPDQEGNDEQISENKPHDEKQQQQRTETLNENTENITKDIQAEPESVVESEVESNTENKDETEQEMENDNKKDDDKIGNEVKEPETEKKESNDTETKDHKIEAPKESEYYKNNNQDNQTNNDQKNELENEYNEQDIIDKERNKSVSGSVKEQKDSQGSNEYRESEINYQNNQQQSEENNREENIQEGVKDEKKPKNEIEEEKTIDEENKNDKDLEKSYENDLNEYVKHKKETKTDNKNVSIKEDREDGKDKENGKESQEEEEEYKTVGEALKIIKEEVKDNVKYLANKIKNVFVDSDRNENNRDERSKSETENGEETKKEKEAEEADIKRENEILEIKSENENYMSSGDKAKETPIKILNIKETEVINKEASKLEVKADQTIEIQPRQLADHTIKEQKFTSAKPSSAKKSPNKENQKTEDDENNNKKNKPAKEIIDTEFREKNKALEVYKEIEDKSDNQEQDPSADIGDKQKEMTDNFKENVKQMTDKVKNYFTSEKDLKAIKTESNKIVVKSQSPKKLNGLKKINESIESSDNTDDEDEALCSKRKNKENPNAEINNADESHDEADKEEEGEKTATSDPYINAKDDVKKEEETLNNEERNDDGSPTSSLAIEGFVQGDPEDNTVQSQTADYVHDDEETDIQNIIRSGNMEKLAQIVLNGDGQQLLNVEATEPEIQAFLRNVPNYMNKIHRVHEAARGGSLLNLQQALDRRKFAIAKDKTTPNGATPLHVAVLFGHSDIVRYLSARFPETTTMTDNDGRTPLHYAAVISDNGHFYNVLLQLGANPKLVDKLGYTPEDYLSKEELKDTLSYRQLLKSFGAEELEQQLLNDQGQIENESCQEKLIFKTEQGKYLADNLADPLIKALTHVAQKRPNDPLQYLANYLQNYVATRNTNGRIVTQAAIHSGSSQTNSTVLANSKSSIPPAEMQAARMNGHVKHNDSGNTEEDIMQQIEVFGDGDDNDGNDSEVDMSKKLEERDEHGQSMLHFACARSHRKRGLIHLIEEVKADITYRDELYRTARDVALQANQLRNAQEIDHYLVSLAIVGDIKPFEHFAISGYDHIIDVLDDNEVPIIDVVESRGHTKLATYLRSIRPLEELREELHQMIRENNMERVKEIANGPNGKWLIRAKNYYGRTALHIAILKESIETVEMFVKLAPETLKIGDNLERTPLHYAMGTNIIENISHIFIQNGAKRTYKDLKGRQPSYYFMNKSDILRLQEEEDENR